MTTKATALRALENAQARLNREEEKAAQAAAKRDAALLAASTAGATRADLETAANLSQARITQVLRRARQGIDN